MPSFTTHLLAAFAAVILALTSISAIVTVPPAKAQISQIVPAMTELA